MIDNDWKTTLAASAISASVVFALGYLFMWVAGL